MKKKYLFIPFIALIVCFSLIMSIGLLAFGESKPGANENLTDKPSFFVDGKINNNYFAEFSKYVNDRFFLRQEFISYNNLLSSKLFNVSGSDSVVLGKDGWLYYESTLNDYSGVNTMSNRDIFAAANNVKLMKEYCEANGIEFAFMVAPNKNSLYSENMPSIKAFNTSYNAKRLHKYFDDFKVNYVDIFKAFSTEPVLYYKTDSHWNVKGAAKAADLVNAVFKKNSNYYGGNFSTIKNGYTGDLYNMLYPSFKGGEDEIIYGGALNYSMITQNAAPDSFIIKTESDNEGSILVYRDSFGNNFYPFIANSYNSATFSRDTVYDLTKDTDFILVELVERNIPWLISNIPVLKSQKVDISLPTASASKVNVVRSKAKSAPFGYDFFSGKLEMMPDDESSVYVSVGEDVYEALITEDNGFAVYLPEGSEPTAVAFTKSGVTLNLSVTLTDDGSKEPANSENGEFDNDKFLAAQNLVGSSIEELYSAIGNPNKSNYLPSCIGVGKDGTLQYNGFTVTTFKDDKGETIKGVFKD